MLWFYGTKNSQKNMRRIMLGNNLGIKVSSKLKPRKFKFLCLQFLCKPWVIMEARFEYFGLPVHCGWFKKCHPRHDALCRSHQTSPERFCVSWSIAKASKTWKLPSAWVPQDVWAWRVTETYVCITPRPPRLNCRASMCKCCGGM